MKSQRYLSSSSVLIIICLIGTALRFWQIAKASFWHDEGFSVMLAHMPLVEITQRTAHDFHPPLYYLILHYWMSLFGSSEVAIRGLSAICTIAIIPLTYVLIRRLWDERVALLAALFVACGPLLVRYGQEARMYGLAALLVVAAAYCFVRAQQSSSWRWWGGYSAGFAMALYTHYYTIFAIFAFMAYVTLVTNRRKHQGWWDWRWWGANAAIAILYIPWLPILYSQYTRNQTSAWPPPVDVETLPDTLTQFLAYGSLDFLNAPLKIVMGLLFAIACAATFYFAKKRRAAAGFLLAYGLAAPLIIYAISFSHSVYFDRYFTFATVGFYALLAVMVALLKPWLQVAATGLLLILFSIGNVVIQAQYTHNMRAVTAHIKQHYKVGDYLLVEDQLSYFDATYYNSTESLVHLLHPGPISGYGESSLYYDRADQVVVKRLEDIQPSNGRVWVISKLDKPQKFITPPAYWIKAEAPFYAADNGATLYLVLSRSRQ